MRQDLGPDPHPLRLYRQRHGITLQALAKRAGTSHSTIIGLERGVIAQPGFDLIRRVSAATGGQVSEIRIILWHHARAQQKAAA